MWNLNVCERSPERLAEALRRRGLEAEDKKYTGALTQALGERRKLIFEIDELNASRKLRAKRGTHDAIEEARSFRTQAGELKARLNEVEASIHCEVTMLPNAPHESVPEGSSAEDNVITKIWGEPVGFTFRVRDHVDLGLDLGLDLPRGTRLAGSGFPCLKGKLARLNRGVINFMLDVHRERRGYMEVAPPFVVNRESFFGTGQLPKFEEDLYWTKGGQLGLVPTAEVPLTNLYGGEILAEAELPKRLTAYTPCWRREAGAGGRDTRGMIRVHQFEKVELVKITTPESSYDHLEELADDAEEILRRLELPHRRVLLCTGDLGFSAAKTYDIEVWLPGQDCYREISSCSNCEDFQARRMKLRFRRANGKIDFVHTLNGSGLAVGRTLVAIIENYQQPDGSIEIPEALVSYVGFRKITVEDAEL